MRVWLIVAMLVATPAAAATWADWVGDYRGALTWRQCAAPGETSVALAIDVVDGVPRIDLAPAGAGLAAMTLIEEAGAWVAQDGDLRVRITRGKRNTVDLALDYDSGCRVRGRLARASAGTAACERLAAWTRIAGRCTKRSIEIPKHGRCEARAEVLEVALVDAGCAPHPEPVGTRAVACRSLVDATSKLARCGRAPREVVQRLSAIAHALSAAAQSTTTATLPYVERQCRDAKIDVTAMAMQLGCPR